MIYSRSVLEKMVSLRKGNRGRRRKRDKEKGERVIERERVRRKSDGERYEREMSEKETQTNRGKRDQ